jgi:hypothetical protein
VQHYNHNVAWNTDFSAADSILRCNTGGRIRFDTQQDENSLGTPHLLAESDRPSAWVLSGGTATSFTDVDFSNYVPYGVTALLLKWSTRVSGDNVGDLCSWLLRKNGSSETDAERLCRVGTNETNLSSSVVGHGVDSQVIVICDVQGIIEYQEVSTDVRGALYLNIEGYFI